MDNINPTHYRECPALHCEVIDITAGMSFRRGNAFKYAARAGLKTADPTEDLRKAEWYLRELRKSCGGNYSYINDNHPDIIEDTVRGVLLQHIYMGALDASLEALDAIFWGSYTLDTDIREIGDAAYISSLKGY